MGVLIPIIFLALAIDIAACGGGWRARLKENRWIIGVTGVVTVASLAVAFGSPSSLGFYCDVVQDSSLSDVPGFVGKQLLAFIVMTGILPFIVLVATSARRDVWRDHDAARAPRRVLDARSPCSSSRRRTRCRSSPA